MQRRRATYGLLFGAIACGVSAFTLASRAPVAAASSVESTYRAPGAATVTTTSFTDTATGYAFQVRYPSTLGNGGTRHPLVTWGNGSDAVPSQYNGLLDHLASWGFVVVASTSTQTGTGAEILAGARAMVAADADPASPFFGTIDTGNVAAVGHSQGAGGSVRASIAGSDLITTTVPIALPAQIWVSKPADAYDVTQLTAPVFFVGGSLDLLISSALVNVGYYHQVPGAAAVAMLRWADHNTIQGTGGRFLGYITAWLRYQLAGDPVAATAFTGATPEFRTNSAWAWQFAKHL
ncbi:MAG TPA: hypothetical protein VNQ73_17635 [Ilumatobacter sp.]|nr:hypothetical protein [Ilumatobacter sp.]